MSAEPPTSWDVLAWFGHTQASLPPPADPCLQAHYSNARSIGARIQLCLPILQDARMGALVNEWRRQLPVVVDVGDDRAGLVLATTALELADLPLQTWEPRAARKGNAEAARNAWYQAVTALLFDAVFLARDAIAERRAPDDEWHRSVLPLVLQAAVMTASHSLATALWPDELDAAASATLKTYQHDVTVWPTDWRLISARTPWYWIRDSRLTFSDENLDRAALRAAQAKFVGAGDVSASVEDALPQP